MGDRFSFHSEEDGWATWRLELGRDQIEWPASRHWGSPLGDLLKALTALLTGHEPGSPVTFIDLPEYYELSLALPKDGVVSIVMTRYPHLGSRAGGEVVLNGRGRLRTLAGSAVATTQRIRRETGEAGYLAEWRSPFPVEALTGLQQAMAASKTAAKPN